MGRAERERARVAGEEIRGRGGLEHFRPPNTENALASIPSEMGATGRF